MTEPFVPGLGAALLPAGISLMVLVAGDRVRQCRRRRALNEHLHELRRPLQALALAAGAPASDRPQPLELALAALQDLDREVNGGAIDLRRRPVDARALAIAAGERWRTRAAERGRRISVRWTCSNAVVDADPRRISQALDNLIANALEHGGGQITLEGHTNGDQLDLLVRDSGTHRAGRLRERRSPRRGHGLRITRRLARLNGGTLRLRGEGNGTVAALVLPLASGTAGIPVSPHRR